MTTGRKSILFVLVVVAIVVVCLYLSRTMNKNYAEYYLDPEIQNLSSEHRKLLYAVKYDGHWMLKLFSNGRFQLSTPLYPTHSIIPFADLQSNFLTGSFEQVSFYTLPDQRHQDVIEGTWQRTGNNITLSRLASHLIDAKETVYTITLFESSTGELLQDSSPVFRGVNFRWSLK